MKSIMIGSLALAFVAAVFYLLMGTNFVTMPALNTGDALPAIAYVAGGCYVLGGMLILARKRWLWTLGLAINTLVIIFFFTMYSQKPDIMLRLPGPGTKIAQILLEAGLIYLVAAYHRKEQLARQTS